MASKQKKWFKSAFAEESADPIQPVRVSPKRAKVENAFRSLSEHDSINLTEFVSEWDKTKSNDHTFTAPEPVKMFYTDFKSSNWIENFAPQSKIDLAIHTKKIVELEDWFRAIKTKKRKESSPILLISGPSGCGKTATVKVIAKEFDYTISEWVTPLDVEYVRRDQNDENIMYSESQSDKFDQFLFQSSRYRSVFDTTHRRLVLVEDFPNVFIKDPSKFEEVLERYSIYGKTPLVFIITDTKSRTLNINHTLFTDQLRQRFGITTINFNAVADTMLKKGLKRVCAIMSQPGFQKYYTEPNKDTIDSIVLSSQGDIRNAVINLHFASQKDSCKLSTEAQSSKTTGCGKKTTKKIKKNKLKSLGCDESLTVMHALGRVFNPKYNDGIDANGYKTLVHSPEEIASNFSTQPSNIITLIHTNYMGHFQNIDDVIRASDNLSRADIILNEYRSELSSEIGMNIAVRGIMITNEKPVTGRWMPIKGNKKNAKPLFDHKKECENLEINSLTSPNVIAMDYRSYATIIQSKKTI